MRNHCLLKCVGLHASFTIPGSRFLLRTSTITVSLLMVEFNRTLNALRHNERTHLCSTCLGHSGGRKNRRVDG